MVFRLNNASIDQVPMNRTKGWKQKEVLVNLVDVEEFRHDINT